MQSEYFIMIDQSIACTFERKDCKYQDFMQKSVKKRDGTCFGVFENYILSSRESRNSSVHFGAKKYYNFVYEFFGYGLTRWQ